MKNVVVSCVYRVPNASTERFKDVFESLVSNTNQRTASPCGDYNIDFLNSNKSPATEEFIGTMDSTTN